MTRLAALIRSLRFDTAFYLMTRGRTRKQIARDRFFFRLCGIRNVLGTDFAKENLLPTSVSHPLPKVTSEGEYLLECLRSVGLNTELGMRAESLLLLTAPERTAATDWLETVGAVSHPERPIVAFAPGSKWESKIWREDRFAEVGLRLIKDFGVFPIIFGGREDRDKGERLLQTWKSGANAAGALTVREAAAALEKCDLFVGNDTGTMHLATTMGVRCVAVFAAIDWPGRWYPRGDGHRIFRIPVECEGCHATVSPNGNKCLELISSEDVYRACAHELETNRTRQTSSLAFKSNCDSV
jgi:ADP-heptose:LPS heptosyltransferase